MLRDDTPGSDAVITLLPDGSMNYYGPQNRLLEKLIVAVNLLNNNCQFVCSRK